MINSFENIVLFTQGVMLLLAIVLNEIFLGIDIIASFFVVADWYIYALIGITLGFILWLLLLLGINFLGSLKKLDKMFSSLPLTKRNFWIVAVIPPIIEEIFFRGILVSLIGVWGSSILFALGHGGFLEDLFSYTLISFLLGLILAYFYMLSGSLWGPIALHMTINLLSSLRLLYKN
ncbi:CPBP family intramembrane glutamic endopeptidase [Fuchsiella alkaliacetigena]|uniref:CPBP family intramembrane glutamic endopeptidase n=1 Tax=Fuchsiella alkaliacetigena TaxID=957042 RepID=UPI00200A9C9C|nr:CPBP family intramembrane glutamic endopeptidase [Fuchsiella alkaliacetigena]MCK8825301.1 CPBP family intramembrane metalloprotease [Fuchsiella alkaliacetigena]